MAQSYRGKIIKGIAGCYYVYTNAGIFQCRARGLFREKGPKPLAGDNVYIELTDTEDVEGNVTEILPRKNSLIRPPVANIDQAVVIFSIHRPEPVWGLLDRFLINMSYEGIPALICINKDDLKKDDEEEQIRRIYGGADIKLLLASAMCGNGIDELKAELYGKTTTVAGPSGAGKSSLINRILGEARLETGEISRKVERGKQTTRHTELIPLEKDTFIFDSPGFSSLETAYINKEELRDYYPEFSGYNAECRYNLCSHTHEPDCAVKEAVKDGNISAERYNSYLSVYGELNSRKRYR